MYTKLIVSSILLMLSHLVAASTKTPLQQTKLFLVGGALKTCTSMSLAQCNKEKLPSELSLIVNKTSNQYNVNRNNLIQLKTFWPNKFSQQTLTKLLKALKPISSNVNLNKKAVKEVLSTYDKENPMYMLSDAEYVFVLDTLEVMVADNKTGKRLKEKVYLSASKNYFSIELFKSFVAQAAKKNNNDSPKVLIVTASARDPFSAVDFYVDAFTQAGANASWLPLNATLQSIWQSPDIEEECQNLNLNLFEVQGVIHRDNIYPDLYQEHMKACLNQQYIVKEIQNADAIFINGGDQSLTIQAFLNNNGEDSSILTLIKEKLANNTLIVGGTSAGTAVMSGGLSGDNHLPMITGGRSNTALARGAFTSLLPFDKCHTDDNCSEAMFDDDLSYRKQGGLGLFHWGIMDSHFSERDRQGRLMTLVIATDAKFAFGVDETTALMVSYSNPETPSFEVLGQGGVYIIENDQSNTQVTTHYLTRYDKATLSKNKLHINLADWKSGINISRAELKVVQTDVFQQENFKRIAKTFCHSNQQQMRLESSWQGKNQPLLLTKELNEKSAPGQIAINGQYFSYCSYQNYVLSKN